MNKNSRQNGGKRWKEKQRKVRLNKSNKRREGKK